MIRKKVILKGGALPHLTGLSQAYFLPGQAAGAHSHQEMYEVFIIESGNGFIRVEGNEYPLGKGTAVVVYPDEVHEIFNPGHETLVITYFGIRD